MLPLGSLWYTRTWHSLDKTMYTYIELLLLLYELTFSILLLNTCIHNYYIYMCMFGHNVHMTMIISMIYELDAVCPLWLICWSVCHKSHSVIDTLHLIWTCHVHHPVCSDTTHCLNEGHLCSIVKLVWLILINAICYWRSVPLSFGAENCLPVFVVLDFFQWILITKTIFIPKAKATTSGNQW